MLQRILSYSPIRHLPALLPSCLASILRPRSQVSPPPPSNLLSNSPHSSVRSVVYSSCLVAVSISRAKSSIGVGLRSTSISARNSVCFRTVVSFTKPDNAIQSTTTNNGRLNGPQVEAKRPWIRGIPRRVHNVYLVPGSIAYSFNGIQSRFHEWLANSLRFPPWRVGSFHFILFIPKFRFNKYT
ncbi:hypothetical protein FB45DRAFT_477182 [Roridomyces roridus]|uniref:Uncharacterized protein n=1 Tax=Roridomyces roridus TaxID=1738132 RepID=A0AAD7BZF6_9AGAR|nr:hypothetical protein FB45DRAFT_477182 [Roridomyces roridus]